MKPEEHTRHEAEKLIDNMRTIEDACKYAITIANDNDPQFSASFKYAERMSGDQVVHSKFLCYYTVKTSNQGRQDKSLRLEIYPERTAELQPTRI